LFERPDTPNRAETPGTVEIYRAKSPGGRDERPFWAVPHRRAGMVPTYQLRDEGPD